MNPRIVVCVSLFAGLGLAAAGAATSAPPAASAVPAAPPGAWETGNFGLLPRVLQKNPKINVIVVTEFTAEGKKRPAADADHPQYFVQLQGLYTEEGDVIAGEDPPPAADLAATLSKSMAEAGYLPADQAHPPTIALYYRWGSFNKLTQSTDILELQNQAERAALVGGLKFMNDMLFAINAGNLRIWENGDARRKFLMQEARANRYFLVASAFDYAAAVQDPPKRLMLWQTKISTESQGIAMDESVPVLVASAAAYFGHPTDGPVKLFRPVVKEGSVTLGTPTVKEDSPTDRDSVAAPAPAQPPAH